MKNKIKIPILPLRGSTVFPYMKIHFDVGRIKSIKALEKAMETDNMIVLSTQKDMQTEDPNLDEIYDIGTIVEVEQLLQMPNNAVRVLIKGKTRCRIKTVINKEEYMEGSVEIIEDYFDSTDTEYEALKRDIVKLFSEYVQYSKKIPHEIVALVNEYEQDYGRFADVIGGQLTISIPDRQALLEKTDVKERLLLLYKILVKEQEIALISDKISNRVKKQVDQNQKEYYLREQIKAIHKELGDSDDEKEEIKKYKDKLSKLVVPVEVKEKVESELTRLEKLTPSSPDIGVIKTYLDWIFDLPWNITTTDDLNITRARKILDEDHYGMEKVKERILEYLAVRKLADNMKGPIICLVGPPGVGKTSIAKSIARAIGRNFERMSLGGMRDEAEIRGHRRTYVGAIPGRVIYALKNAKSNNPLILFDEIDKLSTDAKGDPSSALLEVLDSEQNKDFRDHYMELPFDLSKVLFLTTANTLDTIPAPLRDRMEIITIEGYTQEEKLRIAMDHLLSKQIKEHSLKKSNIKISEKIMLKLIDEYTRESGVRGLEREISKIIRKVAVEIVENNKKSITIKEDVLINYLGKPKYRHSDINNEDAIGLVTGLAWTAVGGETLSIEVNTMPGTGKLELTGQLGDVMKESAKAALSYVRSNTKKLGIEDKFYKNLDIHIHVPEGATPKDGPSAGITMTTALVSALTHIPVSKDIAMTGEVTLRGRVLPIGGLKEKALAASRMGIKTILIPIDNERDIDEMSDTIKEDITFIPVNRMDEVLKYALKR